ncbi:MAG: TonB-dependent receptor [Pseudomonadota bacterium]
MRLASALVAVGVLSGVALAQEAMESREVSVTATRMERGLLEVPVSTTFIGPEEIRRSGAESVGELLRDVPGVEVFDNGAGGAKRVSIRGESGQRVLILVDGQKIGDQKSMDGSPILVSLSEVESVEVIKGPASVLYGSEAIGGVVKIKTKRGGHRPVQLHLGGGFDSSTSGVNGDAALHGSYQGFSYRLSGALSDQGDRDTPDGKLEHSDYNFDDYRAAVGYDRGPISLGAGYQSYDSAVHVNVPSGSIGAPITAMFLDLPQWSLEKYDAFAEYKGSGALVKLRADAYWQRTLKDFINNISMSMMPGHRRQLDITTNNDQKTWGGSLQGDLAPAQDHYLIAGLDWSDDGLEARERRYQTDNRIRPLLSDSTYLYEGQMRTMALFIQDEWAFHPRFSLTAGLRQTWVESELTRSTNPSVSARDVSDDHLVGNLGLVFRPAKDLSLRAVAGQGYRFPNLQQLYIGTLHGGSSPTFPNPDLKPETSASYELGLRRAGQGWLVDLGVFYSQADDYITTMPVNGGLQYANVDGAETHGLELQAQYTMQPLDVTPYLSGTFSRRQFKYEGGSTWDTGLPPAWGRLGLRLERKPLRELRWWGDVFARGAMQAEQLDTSSNETVTYDSWVTGNLATGVIYGPQGEYRLSLEFNNIFNTSYTTASETLPAPGQYVALQWSLEF